MTQEQQTPSEALEAPEEPSFSSKSSAAVLVFSISVYAFLGAVARFYLGRYLQCDTSISSRYCVTLSQSALFVDLPANLLGSFLMGIISHPCWKDAIHPFSMTAWQVGFCGSLTTFASWNMQMVIMLEQGKIASALFGYVIGTVGAYGSFVAGDALATLIMILQVPLEEQQEQHSSNTNTIPTFQYPAVLWLFPPTLLSWGLLLLILFLTTTTTVDDDFQVASFSWTAPAGALLRWQLSVHYNTPPTPTRGTLVANWSACILFAVVAGLHLQSIPLTAGFIGSLSTVSTWVKEIHATPWNWVYAVVSLVGAMLLGLVIYVPLHRFVSK